MTTQKITCQDCTGVFDAEVLEFNGRTICFQTLCQSCLDKRVSEENQKQARIAHNASETAFWAMFPPIYRETDKSRLDARLRDAIDGYSYGETGLGFSGGSGAGKTRSMVLLLKRMHEQGKSVMFLKATRLTEVAYQRFDDDYKVKSMAKAAIDRSKSCACLLIDDLGKGRLPQSAEELLFDIIDTRSEMGLPLFWTSNAKSADLHANFSPDRADPIIRRIAEFTRVVTI